MEWTGYKKIISEKVPNTSPVRLLSRIRPVFGNFSNFRFQILILSLNLHFISQAKDLINTFNSCLYTSLATYMSININSTLYYHLGSLSKHISISSTVPQLQHISSQFLDQSVQYHLVYMPTRQLNFLLQPRRDPGC